MVKRVLKSCLRLVNAATRRSMGTDINALMERRCPVIRSWPKGSGIALTFDDGPHPEFTPIILDALAQYGIRATFFCVGRNAQRYPAILRKISAAGHEIGNHTMTHPNLHWVTGARLRAEVLECQSVLQDILGSEVRHFRAPFGNFRWDLSNPEEFGLQCMVGWDVAPQWKQFHPEGFSDVIRSTAQNGSIVLLHDCLLNVEEETASRALHAVAASIAMFGPELKDRLGFKTLSELRQSAAQEEGGDPGRARGGLSHIWSMCVATLGALTTMCNVASKLPVIP
jgi:hypothetical protein